MIKRPGHVFSREQLMREVWNDQNSNSNVVEVYVRYLRQKLEAGGSRRLLHGAGPGLQPRARGAGGLSGHGCCPPEPPQQWLPVRRSWCVAQQRCIDLEVARSPEQQRIGLMQRPALPPLRGMWFPFAGRAAALLDVQHPCASGHGLCPRQPGAGDLSACRADLCCPALSSYAADTDGNGRG